VIEYQFPPWIPSVVLLALASFLVLIDTSEMVKLIKKQKKEAEQ